MSNVATQFKKGISGNPKGRPKEEWTMKGLLRESLDVENEQGIPYKKVVSDKLVALAVTGDVVAIKEVNNRIDGLPEQKTDITSGGKPMLQFNLNGQIDDNGFNQSPTKTIKGSRDSSTS